MHAFLGICLLLVGFCYTQDEYNFYVGGPFDYSKLNDKTLDAIKNNLKNEETPIEGLECFANVMCTLGEDERGNLTTCYEEAGRDTSVFEEERKKLCDKDPTSQYVYLFDNLWKYVYRCEYNPDNMIKEECSDDIKGPFNCILGVKLSYDEKVDHCDFIFKE